MTSMPCLIMKVAVAAEDELEEVNPTSEINNLSWKLGHRSRQDSRWVIGIMDFTVNASVLSSKDK